MDSAAGVNEQFISYLCTVEDFPAVHIASLNSTDLVALFCLCMLYVHVLRLLSKQLRIVRLEVRRCVHLRCICLHITYSRIDVGMVFALSCAPMYSYCSCM